MITFTYQIHSCMGLHARPASDLSTIARSFTSKITMRSKNRSANVRRIVDLMEMNVCRNEIVIFEIEGDDEQAAAIRLQKFCERNL